MYISIKNFVVNFFFFPPNHLMERTSTTSSNRSSVTGKYQFGSQRAEERYGIPENFLEIEVSNRDLLIKQGSGSSNQNGWQQQVC